METVGPNPALNETRSGVFQKVSSRVERRVMMRRGVEALEKTALVAGGSLLMAALAMGWLVSGTAGVTCALMGMVAWVLGTLVWSGWRRPNGYSCWARWDQAADRREAFAAAWWVEQQETPTKAEKHHLEVQCERLPTALERLAADLPVRRPDRALMAIGVLGLVMLLMPKGGLLAVDDTETVSVEVAMAGAKALEEMLKLEADEAGLSAEEAANLEKEMAEAVKELEEGGGKSLREVMAALEARARGVEKLAARMGAEGEIWASPEMTEALRKETDTADLGDAVADRSAQRAAEAAEDLAEALGSPERSKAMEDRMREALQRVAGAALEEDGQRRVGEPVLEAGEELKAGEVEQAAAAMQRLAEAMRDLAEREQTQERLERLAQQLREAGSRAAGGDEAMEQMAGVSEGQAGAGGEVGQASPEGGPQGAQAPQVGQAPLQPPGLANAPQPAGGSPSPSEGSGQSMEIGQADPNARPGEEAGDGPPRLMAPVPGKPGEEPPDQIVMGPPGGPPGDSGFTMAGSGLNAGVGRAELNAEATAGQASGRQALVQAQDTGEGKSSFREVEGGAPSEEEVRRKATEQAMEFLQAQEAAMDDTVLPANRRDQVRRYFNELRRRFEGEP